MYNQKPVRVGEVGHKRSVDVNCPIGATVILGSCEREYKKNGTNPCGIIRM